MQMDAQFRPFYLFPISTLARRLVDPKVQLESVPSQQISFRSDAVKDILNLSVTQMDWTDATLPPAEPSESVEPSSLDSSILIPEVNRTEEARLRIRGAVASWCHGGVVGRKPSDVVSKKVDQVIEQFFPKHVEITVDIYRFFAYTPHTNLDQNMPREAQKVGEIHRNMFEYIQSQGWYQTPVDREIFWQSVCAKYNSLPMTAEFPGTAFYGLLGALLHYVPSRWKWVLFRTASRLTLPSVCLSIERMLRTKKASVAAVEYAYFELPSVRTVATNSGNHDPGYLYAADLLQIYGQIQSVHPGMPISQLPSPFDHTGLPTRIPSLSPEQIGWMQEWKAYEAHVIQQGGTSALYTDGTTHTQYPQLSATHILHRDRKIPVPPGRPVESVALVARKRPGDSRPFAITPPPPKSTDRRSTPPLAEARAPLLSVGQLRYDDVEEEEFVRRRDCVPTQVVPLPPPPRGPPGGRIVENCPALYFKFQGVSHTLYTDGIQASTISRAHPERILPGWKQPFTYCGNTFWGYAVPQSADINPTYALGPSWSFPSEWRGSSRYLQFQRRMFPLRTPSNTRTELFHKVRTGRLSPPAARQTVRPSRNEDCVRLHGWPNTDYGRKAQLQRSIDLVTAYDYEQATRSQAARETMAMEALDDSQPLQTTNGQPGTHAQRTKEFRRNDQDPSQTHLNFFVSRDRDPETVIQRAASIVVSTFGVHPRFPPGPVVAKDVAEAKTMFRSLRTTPVFGGDPQRCPLVTSLSFETIIGTQDMLEQKQVILWSNANTYRRQVQAAPREEQFIYGLYQGLDWANHDDHDTPLQTFPILDPDPSAYVYWSEENKRRMRYVPNVQTTREVPYALILFRHNLPVFVIPLYLLFEPSSLFDAQMNRKEYYKKVKGKSKTVSVNLASSPSVPSPWALDALSGIDVRRLGYQGHLWLVANSQRELRLLTTAFPDVTATRTHLDGCPDTDARGMQDLKHAFPGRNPSSTSTNYIPFLSLTDCFVAAGESRHYQPISEHRGEGKVPPFQRPDLMTLLLWTEGTRYLSTPGVGWIIDQNLGNIWPRIQDELARGLHHSDQGLLLEYGRGPPELQPPLSRRQKALTRVSAAVTPEFTRLRGAFFRTTNGDLAVILSQGRTPLFLDAVPQYYLLLNFAVRRTLTPVADEALKGPFGQLVDPILQAIRRDCQTPFLFRKLRTPSEMEADSLRDQERQSLCLLAQPIKTMWTKITDRIEAILPPLARVQYGKWKALGMQMDDTRPLNCWEHYRELILHWAFEMANIPTSPRSTVILRQLILQHISEIWIKTTAIQWTEDISRAYTLGLSLLPVPFQSPRALPEPLLARPVGPPRFPYFLVSPNPKLTPLAQDHALLMRIPMRIPVEGQAPAPRVLRFRNAQGGEQLPWDQGLPRSRNLVPGGREIPGPSVPLVEDGSFKVPGSVSADLDPQKNPDLQEHPDSAGNSGSSSSPEREDLEEESEGSLTSGGPLRTNPEIDQLLTQFHAFIVARKYPTDGSWKGRSPPAPRPLNTVRTHFEQLMRGMKRDQLDYASWFSETLQTDPLESRLRQALNRLEKAEARLTHWDPSGYIEEVLSTGGSISPEDYGQLIEALVWKYGDALLRTPPVLERYILGPLRQAHPGLFIPHLPWFLWRAHPGIPISLRLSLRLWFAHHFGFPTHQVQSVVVQGTIFSHDGDAASQVFGPACSAWWPEYGRDNFQEAESWGKLYPQLLQAAQEEMRAHSESAAPAPRWAFGIRDEIKNQVVLFGHGFVPDADQPNDLVLQPLRRRDAYLAEILPYHFGLPMLAPLPLREIPELQFPREGDLDEDLGLEEHDGVFYIPSLDPKTPAEKMDRPYVESTDASETDPAVPESGASELGKG